MFVIPSLIQVLIIFIIVVIATAKKVHLGLAAVAGGVGLALFQGLSIQTIALAIFNEATHIETILLLVLMASIMGFSLTMKKSGALEDFSKAITAIVPSNRIAMSIAPMLIGTLPMPGGAILSAPLVDAMADKDVYKPDILAAANYWFRHCLELDWPLYTAFILTVSLSGISTGKLILLNLYAPILLFILGLVFVLPNKPQAKAVETKAPKQFFNSRLKIFFNGMMPLLLVLGIYITIDVAVKIIYPMSKNDSAWLLAIKRFGPVFAGLIVGSIYIAKKFGGLKVFKGCITKSTLDLLAIVLGIRIFSALLASADIASKSALELAQLGIPSIVAVALLPFIAGLVTGVGFGYVGLAFPIVIGLVSAGSSVHLEPAIILAGAYGYMGMMLSPLHICMVVSAQHFSVGLASTIKKFAIPLFIFIFLATIYVFLMSKLY